MHRILIAISAIVLAASAWAQPAATFRAKADSTTVLMGDRVAVDLEVLKNGTEGQLVDIPEREKDYHGLELVDIVCDTASLGNDRYQEKYHLVFQAFYPADLLTLPPFRYAIGDDTLRTEILTFKVLPVDLSPELGSIEQPDSLTIHPSVAPVQLKSKFYDYIPNWIVWVFLGLVVIALGIVAYLLFSGKGKQIMAKSKPKPPYEVAVARLAELREKHLLEQGHVKAYYTDLIDIFRTYLEGRFGINAMEMPSTEILRRMRENKEIHLTASQMQQALQLADFVKFAAANPNPEEGLRTFNTVSQFVETTKPVVEAENEAEKHNKPQKP